jgi:hypothetical protein
MKTLTIESMPGMHITDACANAVEMAKRENCYVKFEFNEISITASPESDATMLSDSYSSECQRRHEAYIASPEYKKRQEELEAKERERKQKADAYLSKAGPLALIDPEGWKKACDAQ